MAATAGDPGLQLELLTFTLFSLCIRVQILTQLVQTETFTAPILADAYSCGRAAFRGELGGAGDEAGVVFSVNTLNGGRELLSSSLPAR